MAFAVSNLRNDTLGSIKVLAGDWTGTAGDADGSLVIATSRVYDVAFRDAGATTPVDIIYATNTAVTTGTTTTLTIPNRETVTRGTFIVFYA